MSMAINFGRVEIYKRGFPFHKVTRSFDHVFLKGQIKYCNCCITTTARAIATKLGKLVTCHKKLQSIKSHNPLNT